MPDLKIRDIIELAEADIDDPESKLQKVFEWKIDRFTQLTKWIFGFAGSLVVALFVGLTKDDISLWGWEFWSLLSSAVLVFIAGLVRSRMAASYSHQFLKGLYLLGKLKRINGFLEEYQRRN